MTPPSPIDGASTRLGSAGRHAAAEAMVGDSWLFRGLERCFELIAIAWETSAVWMGFVACFGESKIGPSQRVRLVGCAVLSAAAVHILLVGFGYLLEPPMVGLGWIVAVPLAGVCIGWPQVTVRALESSRVWRGHGGSGS
jgi:hypothetical protein